jgi:hypothetical protein
LCFSIVNLLASEVAADYFQVCLFSPTLHASPPPLVLIGSSQHSIVMSRFSLPPPLTPCHHSPLPPPPSRGRLPLLLPEPRLLLLVQACCKPHTPKRQALQCGPRCTQTPAAGCSKCSPPPRTGHPRFQVSFIGPRRSIGAQFVLRVGLGKRHATHDFCQAGTMSQAAWHTGAKTRCSTGVLCSSIQLNGCSWAPRQLQGYGACSAALVAVVHVRVCGD